MSSSANTGLFVVSGADVALNANVSTRDDRSDDGEGVATISNGTEVFEADDIVVVTVQDITDDGQIDGSSGIIGITVFDTQADYEEWLSTDDESLIKYDYDPQNPGQEATVQSDQSGLGDTYVRFNGSVLVSDDAGAPQLGNLIIAPDTGISDGSSVTTDYRTDLDFDGDNTISDGIETGDRLFYVGDYVTESTTPCFARGTFIATPDGARKIEDLNPGDLVITRDNGAQPIRWVGVRSTIGTGDDAPVTINSGALGNAKQLVLSPNHRVLVTHEKAELLFGEPECLVAAKFLCTRDGVSQAETGRITYHHIMLEHHEIITANGIPCESLLPVSDHMHPLAWKRLAGLTDTPEAARLCLRQYEAELLD